MDSKMIFDKCIFKFSILERKISDYFNLKLNDKFLWPFLFKLKNQCHQGPLSQKKYNKFIGHQVLND